MDKNEIIRETLRLMFAVENASGDIKDIPNIQDYIDKIDGSLNRAIIRVCQAKKAGTKTITISKKEDLEELKSGLDLTTLEEKPKILKIDKVVVIDKNGTISPYNDFYTLDYKTIVIDWVSKEDKIKIFYYPSNVELTELREDVAAILPLFIKSELYEEDEASLALQARSLFESALQAIEMNPQTIQTKVTNVFGVY